MTSEVEKKPATPTPPSDASPKPENDFQEQDDYLEEALEETFPGSDAISPGHVSKK